MWSRRMRGPRRELAALLILAFSTVAGACSVRGRAAELYPQLAEFEGREIERVIFVAPGAFDKDTLRQIIETEPSHCSFLAIPICVFGLGRQTRVLEVVTVAQDAARLALFYRRSGYFGTVVRPEVTPTSDDEVAVRFLIAAGPAIQLDTLEVTGTEGIIEPADITDDLPLQSGELFDLGEFDASADSLRAALQRRGYAYAEILQNYDADIDAGVATASIEAVPGPRVVVDSIAVFGANRLGREATLRQLPFKQGDVLRTAELAVGQRNLYTLELVQFASVTLAPDSLQTTEEDRSRATVVVQLIESPVYLVDALAGFGTVECFRAQTRWVSRSFFGGARRLAVSGSVSKIGLAAPTDIGLGKNLCRAFAGDPFAKDLDFRVAVDLTQPYFRGPNNQLLLNAHAERQSEPGIFLRESQGSRGTITRRIGLRDAASLALEVQRGRTIASNAIFCLALQTCTPSGVESAKEPRFRNAVLGSYVMDRTDRVVNPSAGYVLRGTATWATPLLLSDVDYVRSTVEGSMYRRVKPGWTAAGFLRIGSVIGSTVSGFDKDFLPPEERFYAGGASSVRGYERNRLGPGVWVADSVFTDEEGKLQVEPEIPDFVPAGGTAVVVANAELRFPSPVLSQRLRLAVFADAGAVDTVQIWNLSPGDLKVTPGVGVRLQTPVGPIRVDVAYNPYAATRGPLFIPNETDVEELVRVSRRYTPKRPAFFQRLRFHLAVGQAF